MLTEDDFTPVPSVEGAFYAPSGGIVYKHERDAMITAADRRGGFRRLLDRLGLRRTREQPAQHYVRDLKDGI